MSLLHALRHTTERFDDPFRHWEISEPLTEGIVAEVAEVSTPDGRRVYDGTRAADNGGGGVDGTLRLYVAPHNVAAFPAVRGLIEELMAPETIGYLADLLQRDFRGAYLRVELIVDRHGFWLQPHKDIKEKLMSMQLYVNRADESESLGTDLYDADLNRVKTIPYRHNTGYLFSAAQDTWHGLEKKVIVTERRSLLINYVTFPTEWKLPG